MNDAEHERRGTALVRPIPAAAISTLELLRWSVSFYLAHLPLLVLVSVVPVVSRWTFVLWEDRTPAALSLSIESVVGVFRLALFAVVFALVWTDVGDDHTYDGVLSPSSWELTTDPAAVTTVVTEQWPSVLWQLLFLGLAFLLFNVGVMAVVTEPTAARLLASVGASGVRADVFARLVRFTVKNLVVIPLFVVCLCGLFARLPNA